ncbi:MAG: hypothetical protein CL769_05925 [Chloroflexi bacterium]|nr:hypothetical protein [Chloroflexota bacterium]|tara:strand:+ start:172 stop:696 length:525 start_codon:yes stop_codon:yes gene_type:complete
MLKNLLSAIILSGLLVVGCGSSDESSSEATEGPKYFEIMNAEKTYSMDDIKGAGLKGIKEFKTDAVDKKTGEPLTPGATNIVLGFFKGPSGPKDIEVRFYSNHDDAVSLGQDPAESITEKPSNLVGNSSVTTLADAGVGMKGSTKYGGYAISGNIVVLCERELQACLDFIEVLP